MNYLSVIFHICYCHFFCAQVAQHLASTYGGKAFDVAKMAQVTGQRWPIVGKRLVSEFPYIEAEVKPDFMLTVPKLTCSRRSLMWVFFLRCCTRSRSMPAQPLMLSPDEHAWASWTCRQPMKPSHALCRSWAKSWTGVRSAGRYDFNTFI